MSADEGMTHYYGDGCDPPHVERSCVFCNHPPTENDWPMLVMKAGGSWEMHPVHRYCILVNVCGQETADLTYRGKKPGEHTPHT